MATINRSSMIRSEAHDASWLSDESFHELSLDAGLLIMVLAFFLVTRFSIQHGKSKEKTRKDPPSDVRTLDRTSASRINHRPACAALPPPMSHERLVLALLQQDDRNPGKVIETYRQCRDRIDWHKISGDESEHIFCNLCVAATRMGTTKGLNALLRDMERLEIPRSSNLYTTLLKMQVSKRLFQDALALWEQMRAEKLLLLDRAAWSCLLFAASELHCIDQAKFFFQQLVACSCVCSKDYGNMIRLYAHRQETRQAIACLEKMRAEGMEPDNFTYNAVFAACCAGKDLALPESLFRTMKAAGAGVDAITYNTLLKSYVQAKRIDKAFGLVSEMEAEGLMPTDVTFGTLLDACINEGAMDRAHEVFQKMKAANCEMNTVLYTTMIKGFVRMNKLDEVLYTFKEMQSREVKADSVTYSLVLKALCTGGQLEAAFDLFNSICMEGHAPDEIMFNNLLSGCVTCKKVAFGERILEDMVKLGVKPTIATFSTLIKLYSECNEFPKALHLIEQMETLYGCVPEQRLHWQLLHACLRMRQRQIVANVFEALIKQHGSPDIGEVGKLLKSSINFNMLEIAVQVTKMSLSNGTRLASQDLQAIIDAAVKKRKLPVADSISELAHKHGLAVRVANHF